MTCSLIFLLLYIPKSQVPAIVKHFRFVTVVLPPVDLRINSTFAGHGLSCRPDMLSETPDKTGTTNVLSVAGMLFMACTFTPNAVKELSIDLFSLIYFYLFPVSGRHSLLHPDCVCFTDSQ